MLYMGFKGSITSFIKTSRVRKHLQVRILSVTKINEDGFTSQYYHVFTGRIMHTPTTA